MSATVVVVGGGYGGVTVAKALDDVADVVLIEPRDAFVHNVATLRAVVDPGWIDKLFIPYDRLLTRGQVLRDRAVGVSANMVELASGNRINAHYIVLATGSNYPYPAKIDMDDHERAKAKLHATHQALKRASHILILGAGPVGLEFAGEIKAAWQQKEVTIVDPRPELIPGSFPDEFRAELHGQLTQLGVTLLLGSPLRELPESEPGRPGAFTVATESGVAVTADLWFVCYGSAPNTDVAVDAFGAALQPNKRLAVTPELRIAGQSTVFAIGDVTAIPEMKMARLAQKHGDVVAGNIRALIEGGSDLATYPPEADAIVLPLGPEGGVSYAPEVGVLGAGPTSGIKSNLYLDLYLDLLGVSGGRS